ncbi:T9SS type B sorting domain-containing protein [Faecalibacter macacae]|uniref:Gliding motility-associated C-terminal domain-containing protein n=1 Tax=Faecalibacter macacae TaxID=1859289 RepID=A0A3L9MGW4_9FLAO|nr:T9SS type B sorting domain-containing protein [Faecalibacter macacae]RLZ11995.1 hypothetical protein EAH69_03545 [Faecalibacter macacae]
MTKLYFVILLNLFLSTVLSQTCQYTKDHNNNYGITHITCDYDFNNSCIRINSEFPAITNSNQYQSPQKIAYNPIGSYNEGISINAEGDDKFIKRINFSEIGNKPFLFHFYGKIRSSLIISTNGMISFREDINEGDYNSANLNNLPLPNNLLPQDAIFGSYQDLIFNKEDDSDIYYYTIGEYPCRKLVINYYKAKQLTKDNIDNTSTFQIILNERTSIIEINIETKPEPKPDMPHKASLIGINDSGMNGIAVPGRNTGNWSANLESYIFIPNGEVLYPVNTIWTNNIDDAVLESKNIEVCEIRPSIYTATATYKYNDDESFTINQQHQITIDNQFPLPKNYNEVICSENVVLSQSNYYSVLNYQSDHRYFKYKFYLNKNDAEINNSNYLPIQQNLEPNRIYYVRIENISDQNCFGIAILNFSNYIDLPNQVNVCDIKNDNIETNYKLENLNCQLFSNLNNVTNIRYYLNGQENEITEINLTKDTKLRVKYDLPYCTNNLSEEISINFVKSPQLIKSEIDFESYEEYFDIITNINPIYNEPFNWEKELEKRNIKLSNDTNIITVKAFKTYQNAIAGSRELHIIEEGEPDKDYRYKLYLRVENSNQNCSYRCYNIVEVNARVKFRRIILNINDTDLDSPEDNPLIYDTEIANIYLCLTENNYNRNLLNDAKKIIKITSPGLSFNNLDISFHLDYDSANDINNKGILDHNVIINGQNTTRYYIRFATKNNNEFVVVVLEYTITPPKPILENVDICVDYAIQEKQIDLSEIVINLLPVDILNISPSPLIDFFADENATIPITNLNLNRNYQTIWIKIRYTQTETDCEQINPLNIRIYSNQGILKSFTNVDIYCDNNFDQYEDIDLESYLNEFVTIPQNYDFKFYKNYDFNTNKYQDEIEEFNTYRVSESHKIYVSIIEKNSLIECYQKLEIQLNFLTNQRPQINLEDEANLFLCNVVELPHVIFNLDDSINQLYLESNNLPFENLITSVKYYEVMEDAIEGNENFINDWKQYKQLAFIPTTTIYARYESIHGCYSIAPVHLNILASIKLFDDTEIEVCDNNLDGIFQFNFREWINERTKDNDTNNDLLTDPLINKYANYRIYLNQKDVDAGKYLTDEQEINFHLDPNLNTTIILESLIEGGCRDRIAVRIKYKFNDKFTFDLDPICDNENDNIEPIDITQFELNFNNKEFKYYKTLDDLNNDVNQIENPTDYYHDFTISNKIYFKIAENGNNCPDLGIINLTLLDSPIFEIQDYRICPETSIIINPNLLNSEIYTYNWFNDKNEEISQDSTLIISSPGKYKLIVTARNGCSYTEEFNIQNFELPEIKQIIYNQNSATIIASGNGTILYSIDNINWQTSNIFDNLLPGIHNFYVKIENENCVVGPFDGVIPNIPNTISPNGDSINDFWVIKNLHVFNGQSAKLEIFDRFGFKLFSQESSTEFNWNGKKDGKPLPSTSYWYIIELPDGRKYTGYINVINKY